MTRQKWLMGKPKSVPLRLEMLEPRILLSGAPAYTLDTLASFGTGYSALPAAGLTSDGSGDLFGTTISGGAHNLGTVFEIAAGSNRAIKLASFNGVNGAHPESALILDASGDLFGTTFSGGADNVGAVFEIVAGSNTLITLESFNGSNGANPVAGLILDGSGNLYGTTASGGARDAGTVFEIAAGSNTITTLASFNGANGSSPPGSLILDGSGNLYGVTEAGGAKNDGTVFEIAAGSDTITTLAAFNGANGSSPSASLVLDGSGNLYGVTEYGGPENVGTVFEVAAGSGTITTLAAFNGSNGSLPLGGLTLGSSGDLYGTTDSGGADNYGTVFEIKAGTSTISTLASFAAANGIGPRGAMVLDSSGNLYGTTEYGGANSLNIGTAFEIAAGSNTITTLASFNTSNGSLPLASLIMDASGNLYGTTQYGGVDNAGTVFELKAGTTTITTLASFNGTDGDRPTGGVLMDGSGNLYGTTDYGGAENLGTVFEIAAGSDTITTLASFNGLNGSLPLAGLSFDGSGNLYGTTEWGGAKNLGTVFEIAAGSDTITTLASFNGSDGSAPFARLTLDGNGNFFGTTFSGGADNVGTVFEIAAGSDTITTLASFDGANGEHPTAGVIMDASGNLYGTAPIGGEFVAYEFDYGTVFELPAGSRTITVLSSFTDDEVVPPPDGSDGADPASGVIMDASGNLYGTTESGGLANAGTFFELTQTAGKLAFVEQPANAQAGSTIPVTVDVEDAGGRVLTTDDSDVTLAISSGTLRGTLTEPVVNGQATFGNLSVAKVGTYTLTAADSADGLSGFASSSFVISPAAASKLAFTTQPANGVVGAALAPVKVTVEDQYGNVETTDTSSVTVALGPSATGSGTLSGLPTVETMNGVATFSDLSVSAAGTYTLEATDGALTAAVSQSFTVLTPTSLAAQAVTFTIPNAAIPGDRGNVSVVATNDGQIPAGGGMTINLYLCDSDGETTGGTLLGQLKNQPVNLAYNRSKTYTFSSVQLPANLPYGTYYLRADVTATLTNPAENSESFSAFSAPVPVAWEFGDVGARKNVVLNLTEADGTVASFSLSGAGTGTVTVAGDEWTLDVTGSTAASNVAITTRKSTTSSSGQISLDDISVDGALAAFSGAGVNLTGAMNVSGSLGALTLNNLTDDGGITLGGAATGKTTLMFNQVQDESLTCGNTISLLQAACWEDSDADGTDSITAPGLTTAIIRKGDLGVCPRIARRPTGI